MKPVVGIDSSVIVEELDQEKVRELNSLAEIVYFDPYAPEDQIVSLLKDAVAIVDRKAKISSKIIRELRNLKLIARTGAGVDETRVDLKAAKERDIIVTYNPGGNSVAVAELTIMLAIALYRKVIPLALSVKAGKWSELKPKDTMGHELEGKAWGILGFGNIGKRVAQLATSFNCKVLGYDPYVSSEIMEKYGVKSLPLEELLSKSDIISIHVPLTESTRHLINSERLKTMKKTAILINVSRGGIIDDKALYESLRNREIAGAALDTPEEEPVKVDNPLLSLDNVIITPHIGGSTFEASIKNANSAIEEVIRFLKGLPPLVPFRY
ncbi:MULTISPECIES: hydroxyacid dehydrogenase [Metallosphaera]|uniref:hydroxyacid dehydrogenase n=1 Tax=Metallosphaera TaxID=41980 RepID=UPI001F05E87B|nr:hydroxyacid dehydrogenase [Metallosphaera sedula]MCH1771580.1 hydroxyacid dehydrogenase [Metallosphaera sedula]MCP6728651.1 hydroxyacid dehydrogenase [Metallosphaera sedula]